MLYTSVDIIGGLGNQLFQIAFIMYFVKKSSLDRKIVLDDKKDCGSYQRKTYWNSLFKDQFELKSRKEIDHLNFFAYHEKRCHGYDEALPYDVSQNIIFKGYFQSFKYIDDNLRDELIKCILSNKELVDSAQNAYNSIKSYFGENTLDDDIVSIHVRRTDYIQYSHCHTNLPMDYYREALKIANKKYVVVFSDDIQWCKENINNSLHDFEKIYFVDLNNVEIEFLLMSMIKHNVIANSTFSLWASFVSSYTNKIIIAPRKWYAAQGPQSWQEVYHKYITNII